MSDIAVSIESIELNVSRLVQKKQQLEKEVNVLNVKNQEFQKKLSDLESKIFDLKEENKILKIAGKSNEGDSKDTKLKINEMIREVDKCLAQLNQ